MRFDDSLKTVLAADMASGFGAQAAWRQLVDLAGRERIAVDEATLDRLAALRGTVPLPVRSASARALAFARPGTALVAFFADDELPVAAPVLRTATLPTADWLALLPRLSPRTRAVLRGRRDLPVEVVRGLESFGPIDFSLAHDAPATAPTPDIAEPSPPPIEAPRSPSPFVPLGEVARGLPIVAEAMRQADEPANDRFEIADIVARIDAFRRDRPLGAPIAAEPMPAPLTRFRFETDATGTIRWAEGKARAAMVGVSLANCGAQGIARVDASVAAAVRGRSRIEAGRLEVGGEGEASGSWRVSATPAFDPASGRFTGYAGIASRPSRHQRAERGETADGLRQLVHELRTPANAVAGFAEFIEAELLGPVPDPYRARAAAIRREAADLLVAIEDLDTAARLDAGALDVGAGQVAIGRLLAEVVESLRPLAARRGATLTIEGEDAVAALDERTAERLVARLLGAMLSAGAPGERLAVHVGRPGDAAAIEVGRPAALAGHAPDALLALGGTDDDDAPLLGIGFTLRLVRNLAAEIGGELLIAPDRLTLRLPAIPLAMDLASSR